jgi:hypothetical protein
MVIMAKKPPFALVYAAEVKQHLRAIETTDRRAKMIKT